MSDPLPGQGLLQLSGIIIDLVYHIQTLPKAGEEAVVEGFQMAAGGGFIAMAAARRAGMSVTYGGGLGHGPLGDIAASAMAKEGIQFVGQRMGAADQGCSTVLIDHAAERTLIAQEGIEGRLGVGDLDWVTTSAFKVWLLSGYQAAYLDSQAAITSWLEKLPQFPPLVFDPSPAVSLIPKTSLALLLKKALWLSANAREAEFLSGESDPPKAAKALSALRSRSDGGVIVRNGADGCYLVQADGMVEHIKGHAVKAVDTNGAGDTHIGSFLAALSFSDDIIQALNYANLAAALASTRQGPATAPAREQVEAILSVD